MHDESTRLIPVEGRAGILAWALVDASDYEEMVQHRWNLQTKGRGRYARRYVYANSTRRVVYMHRQILDLLSPSDRKIHVDHINRNGLDNRRLNLRRVTNAQNCQNLPSQANSTSRHRGVCWDPARNKWTAKAMVAGRLHFLGNFVDEEEAAAVVSAFRAKHMPYSSDAQRAA